MPFTKLEDETMERKDLTLGEKVLFSIVVRMQGKKEEAYPSQQTLADRLSCSITTVKSIIASLESKGMMSKRRVGFNRTNRYSTNSRIPAHGQPESDPHIAGIRLSMSRNPTIHEETIVIDPPTRPADAGVGGSWLTGWTEFFRDDAEYDWADWKDANAVASLESFLALGLATKDETNDELAKVWDEYRKGDIKSIPAVLLFRLKEKYGR